jgi:hypothetical protein
MTASVAAVQAGRFSSAPRLFLVSRNAARFAVIGVVAVAAVVLAPALSQGVILLAAPAVVLALISRGIPADDLDAQTLRIVLGLPRPID